MAQNYTEGSVEFDIGAQGNRMLVALHEEVVEMEEHGSDSEPARRFYAGLSKDTAADSVNGNVELSDNGVWLYGDEQFPDDYFAALVRFVLCELKLPNVVGWECSVRCDAMRPGEFGGFITCVSARGIRFSGTGVLLREAKEELTDSMARYLAAGGEL